MHPYNPSPHASCVGDGHQQPGLHDPRWFDTTFGVRFAMHLCYDSAFFTPAAQLAMNKSLGIADVVFSTHWENEEGPPMSLGTAYFQSYSLGHGVNLLAANAGIGQMHTGSGIFSQGRTLASSWRPGAPHDPVLLVSRVPRLTAPRPLRVDSVVRPWGGGRPSTLPPAWRTVLISPGSAYNFSIRAGPDFTCRIQLRTAVTEAESEWFALVAVNGSFFGGGLPARGCFFYRLPAANVAGGINQWRPWFEGAATLYRTPNATQATEDLATLIVFSQFSLHGDFAPGDIVLPMLAAEGGSPGADRLEVVDRGRGVQLRQASAVTQAQIYLNTHEPVQIFH